MKSWINAFLLLLILPCCIPESRHTIRKHVVFSPKNLQTTIDAEPVKKRHPSITVWVHGTRLFYAPGPLSNFLYTKPGLHLASEYEQKYHMNKIGKTLVKSAPDLFSDDTFYIFGWSGKLDFGVREQTAEQLYQELTDVMKKYEKKYKKRPLIRVITHSHGGNVVLNIARIPNKKPSFHIDELILLACPVQHQTASLIKHSMFKKIFCIYSKLDMCQILDPQGFYKNAEKSAPWLSGRYFPEQDNLEQVTIKMNGRAIFHSEFVFDRFLTFLPDIINTMENWHKETVAQQWPFNKFIKMLHVRTNGKPFKRIKHTQPAITT